MTLISHHLLLENWTVLEQNPEKVSFDIFDKHEIFLSKPIIICCKNYFFFRSRMTDTSHNENSDSTPDRLENANQTLKVISQCENEKNLLP